MAEARLSRATREQQMLDIATEVFCQRGYAGASMNEIADRCGVSKPMLYLYFDSKDGLYRACLSYVGEALVAAVEQAVAQAHTPYERIVATAAGLFTFAEQRDRQWWGVIYSETMPADPEIAAAMQGYRSRLTDVLLVAVRDLVDDPLDAELAVAALIGAGESALRWWVGHPEVGAAELTSRLSRLVLPTLGAASYSGPSFS